MKLYYLFFLSFFTICKAQTKDRVYDFIKVSTNFANRKPIIVKFTSEDLNDYFYSDSQYKNKINKSDSILLSEMIQYKKIDTSNWTYYELPNIFIVDNNKVVFKKNKYNFKIKDSINNILKIRSERPCNYGNISEEILYSISRPIFDKSSTLAIVQYELLNCKNEGYIMVKLYKKINKVWTFVDDLASLKRSTRF